MIVIITLRLRATVAAGVRVGQVYRLVLLYEYQRAAHFTSAALYFGSFDQRINRGGISLR